MGWVPGFPLSAMFRLDLWQSDNNPARSLLRDDPLYGPGNDEGHLDLPDKDLGKRNLAAESPRFPETQSLSSADGLDLIETNDLFPPIRLVSPELPRLFQPEQFIAGRFVVSRFIARGGMGEVYEAWDTELKERIALKTVRPELASNAEVLERFRREVKQARAISHPNVCRVHELFCHEPAPGVRIWFLSMEFLEGSTLSDYIRHHGPMNPLAALELVEQLADGLTAAHSLGVIHRDFKTSNVMLVSAGPGRLRVVITDFGLALNILNARGELREPGGQGTPDFMAPRAEGDR